MSNSGIHISNGMAGFSITLKVAGWATAINLVLGVGVGYALSRWRFPGRDVLDAMQHEPKKSLRLEKIWQLKLLLGKNSQIARKKDKQPDVQYLPRQYK